MCKDCCHMPPGQKCSRCGSTRENRPLPAVAVGLNPDHKGPPVKRWHTVEVVAAPGTEFGIVEDTDYGLLALVTRRIGEEWPHGMKPKGGENVIAPGFRVYCVRSDEQGWDVVMWQRFAGYCRSCALSGEKNPMDFDEFVMSLRRSESTVSL